ncbi:unnamed protein product [Coregonus sp. 'balchen']|nr:unnamed protein product [Coregonus sp. 'balchen']
MEEMYLLNYPGVKKKILSGGNGPMPHFPPGTKLVFHFQTLLDNFERTVIDDSRKAKAKVPMEIFVGKMFKMEVWETLLTSMRIGEVAEFWCDAVVGDPFSYKRESWIMDKDEKMKEVPSLHLQGNALVRQGCFREAAKKYQEAVVLLRIVLSKEMPGDEDYIAVDRLITPLVLNYCQCMLELEEYYEVLEHTNCVKAYYKRAKAHAAVWNEKEAKRDFNMVANLDITLAPLVHKELKFLADRLKEKYWEEKEKYWNCLEQEEKQGKKEEDEEEEDDEGEEGKKGKKEEKEDGESTETKVKDEEESKDNSASSKEEVKHDKQDETGWKKAIEKDGTTITATVKDKAKVKDRTANQATMKDETASRRTESTPETQPETNQSALSVIEGMDWQQKLRHIMFLEKEGNFLLTEQKYSEATRKFKEALEYVDFIQNKMVCYKERREDWDSLEKVRVPITLNLSQCLLELRDYQEVVALNTKLLKKHRDNFKAVYQRARAHSALCNEEEARNDFQKVERLEPRFKPIVNQEMKRLGENLRNKHISDKKNYWEATEEKWGLNGTKTKARKVKKTVKFQEEKKGEEGSVQKEGETVKEGGSDGVREEKKPEGKGEEGSAKKAAIAEKEGGSRGVEKASGNRRESVEVERDGQAGVVNRAGDKETDMAQTNAGRDNVATERSGKDTAVERGKCHSTAAQEVTKGSTGNKGTNESTRSRAIQSQSTNRSPLATADLPNLQATEVLSEVAEEIVRLDTQMDRPNKGEAEESKMDEGSKTEGKRSDEQPCPSEGAIHTKSGVSTGNINQSFKSKSKRKHKKKK